MLWKRIGHILNISLGLCFTTLSYGVETYVEGEVGYCNPGYQVHGPCPYSACTHWPLIGTDTPRPLPDDYCRTYGRGFLYGLQGGFANTHWEITQENINVNEPGTTITPNTLETDGLAARVYVGYDFNRYFGVESGFTYLPETTVEGVQVINGISTSTSGAISNKTVDLLAKLMWPLCDRFGFYVKGGAAYYHSSTSGFLVFSDDDGKQSERLNHIGFASALGIFFHIVPNLTADATWMRFYGNDHLFTNSENINADTLPNADALMVGISYKFEQKYVPSI